MNSWLVYSIGRVAAVATRPLLLFLANNHLAPGATQAVAIVFLANLLATIWVSADPHRRYLSRRFSQSHSYNGVLFYLYAASLAVMMMAGSAIVFTGSLYFSNSAALAITAVAYFVSERFSDEIQRIRIFERRFVAWGWLSIWRGALQVSTFAVLILTLREATPAWLIALCLALCNFILFIPQLPKPFLLNLRRWRIPLTVWLISRAARLLKASWPVWLTAQLTATFGYLDRGAALILDRELLPLFMLVVMCFSIVQLTMDFYYVSRHRREFLERRVSLWSALTNREFVLSFASGLVLGAIACAIVLHYSRNGASFPWSYIAVIAFLQTAVGVSIIPREILYWNDRFRTILHIEFVFWGLFLCVVAMSWWLSANLSQVFAMVVGCATFRLVHYLAKAARITPQDTQRADMESVHVTER